MFMGGIIATSVPGRNPARQADLDERPRAELTGYALGMLALCATLLLLAPAGIEWEKDLDSALAASRESGRPVILYFTFDT
jgi:hypothetical protein